MSRTLFSGALVALTLACAGCAETAGRELSFPLSAGGTGVTRFDDDGWSVTVERASIALGPAYFCGTEPSDPDGCAEAVAEMRASVTVDALAPPVALAEVRAVTGTVRSAMWDHGLSFFLPDEAAHATLGAIDGYSARFSGTIDRGAEHVAWTADVELAPSVPGTSAVEGVATEHELVEGERGVTLRFDPSAILASVDWNEVAASAAAGVAAIEPGSTAHDAIVAAMRASALPEILWDGP